MSTFTVKQGDYHRRLSLTVTDLSLTGATAVKFRMKSRSSGALVVNRTQAGGVDTVNNKLTLTFQGSELDTAGMYDLEAEVTFADGTETVPTSGQVVVVIEAKLA